MNREDMQPQSIISILIVAVISVVFGFSCLCQASELTVALPKSDLSFHSVAPKTSSRVLELSFSNWHPVNLTEPSFSNQASYFSSPTLPQITLASSLWSWRGKWIQFTPEWGLGFTQLERKGSLAFADQSSEASEVMNLYSTSLLAEVSTSQSLWNLRPYLQIGFEPSLGQVASSQLSTGFTKMFLAAELNAAVAWDNQWMASMLSLSHLEIEAGLTDTHGLFGSRFDGIGALIGTRMTL